VKLDPKEALEAPARQEEQTPGAKPKPRCPNCGWGNVRIAHTKGMLDRILSTAASIQRFKCRSCGRYFRHRYRIAE
jgi:transposase-like protein